MDRQMQVFEEVFESLVSTQEILKEDHNPVYRFDDQLIDGAIIDIGCGQTSSLLKYAASGRRLIGIDNEQSQLNKLRSRMTEVAGFTSREWELLKQNLQHDPLPKGIYAMVVLFNILHFFSLKYCERFVEKLEPHLKTGSILSICVHSVKYFANDPTNPQNNEYFKHYFSQDDLDKLFPSIKYDRLYRADIETQQCKKYQEVAALWAEKLIEYFKIADPLIKADLRQNSKDNNIQADLICVYKRR
ncbi:MAG: class I SAM-dependent methyltransferase [Bacteroidetes bacterium]|jgi:cyclopropane fatty-acyl-phospholipid synthase-like methyltransferase|nr:class I SAM-dependent methyltransferase [Bacteroidota bacterium]